MDPRNSQIALSASDVEKGILHERMVPCRRNMSGRVTLSPLPPLSYIGWVGVGWQRHYKTRRSLRELIDNQGTVFVCFVFFAVA